MAPSSSSRPEGLAAVLRRAALDPAFAVAIVADPAGSLDGYDLSAADLSALSLWLEHPPAGAGLDDLFDKPAG